MNERMSWIFYFLFQVSVHLFLQVLQLAFDDPHYYDCANMLEVLPTKNHCSSLGSKGIKSLVTTVPDLQHKLKVVQGENQERGPLYSGKNRQNRPSDRYFQEKILRAQFLASFHT